LAEGSGFLLHTSTDHTKSGSRAPSHTVGRVASASSAHTWYKEGKNKERKKAKEIEEV
jgi:hypothetical protein